MKPRQSRSRRCNQRSQVGSEKLNRRKWWNDGVIHLRLVQEKKQLETPILCNSICICQFSFCFTIYLIISIFDDLLFYPKNILYQTGWVISPGDAIAEPGATTPRWERRVLDLLAEELVPQPLGGTNGWFHLSISCFIVLAIKRFRDCQIYVILFIFFTSEK